MSDTNDRDIHAQEEGEAPRPRRRKRKKRNPILVVLGTLFKIIGTLILIGVTTGALLCCFGVVFIQSVVLPNARLDLSMFNIDVNSTMYYTDEYGVDHELRTLHGVENRVWVPYADLPEDLIHATIAIEDRRFPTHNGVDWKRTAAAVLYMFTGRNIQGGSTITQQLIKNLTGNNETTVKRKVTEIFTALNFDATYGKQTTLEWYLNYIDLGHGCRGVYTAAYGYFGKPLSELTVAECASLISITNNPSLYDPYVYPENNLGRKDLVLQCMHEQGYLNDAEYAAAKAQELVFTSKKVDLDALPSDPEDPNGDPEDPNAEPAGQDGDDDRPNYYSWYEEQVIQDVVRDLMAKYGISKEVAENMVLTGGLHIYTCVDPRIQAIAESIYLDRNNFDLPSKSGQQLMSAVTIINNATGDVVAIVGNVGEKKGNLVRNNATAAHRQPGSSIKPLSVYAPALDMGLVTPISIIDDYAYEVYNGKPYPVNSGTQRYNGLTTVYTGLTNSTNTIAFRILSDLVTPIGSFNFVQDRFHIDLVEARQVGNKIVSDIDRAPLSMGGLTDGVNTRDMAEAFATFPNAGVYQTSRTYTRVVDSEGRELLSNTSARETVLKESTAYYMNSMLSNVVRSGTGGEAKIAGMHVAGKTGSTTSDCDKWFAGYTPYYTAVVWTGYSNSERVILTNTGIENPAAVIWQKVMAPIHEGLEDKEFFTINNLVSVSYCRDSGLLATDACRSDVRGSRVSSMYLLRDDAPNQFCTVHRDSEVTLCTGDPIPGANRNWADSYHLAGEYCPEEGLITVSLLNYQREPVGTAVARDQIYTLEYVQSLGTCTIHTEPPEPEVPDEPEWPGPEGPEDPNDPGWLNPNWPAIDPNDPGGIVQPVDPTIPPAPEPEPQPGYNAGTLPDPGPDPQPEPDPGRPDDAYVPAA